MIKKIKLYELFKDIETIIFFLKMLLGSIYFYFPHGLNMGRALYHAVFIPAIIAGLFMGTYLKTGQDIDPTGIAISISDAIMSQTGGNSKDMWENTKNSILLISFIATIIDIFIIISAGPFSIISAIGGYLGMIMLVTGFLPTLGILFLIVGEVISLIAPS